jgi:hypothetical protein
MSSEGKPNCSCARCVLIVGQLPGYWPSRLVRCGSRGRHHQTPGWRRLIDFDVRCVAIDVSGETGRDAVMSLPANAIGMRVGYLVDAGTGWGTYCFGPASGSPGS